MTVDLENFFSGYRYNFGLPSFLGCVYTEQVRCTHTHPENRHTLDSLFILVSRDWVVFFFDGKNPAQVSFFLRE
jgi:gamma-glutamylcysteine synthetase